MSWPNGQGIGLSIVRSPVRPLLPRDKGGAHGHGGVALPVDAVPNLMVEYINKGFFISRTLYGHPHVNRSHTRPVSVGSWKFWSFLQFSMFPAATCSESLL